MMRSPPARQARRPDAVELILRKLLKKSPEQRFESADELIATLDRVGAGRSIDRRLWFAAVAGGLALVGLAYAAAHRPKEGSHPPPSPRLAANDLVIDLSDTSFNPKRSGKLGETTYEVRLGGQVTLRAELSRSLLLPALLPPRWSDGDLVAGRREQAARPHNIPVLPRR